MSNRLKEGFYGATIKSWSLGESKQKGTPQFVLTFELDFYKGPGGRKDECPTLTRSCFRAITEGTIDYFVKDLKALGYDRDDFDGLDPKSSVAFDFEGTEIEVKLKYETYEGKEQERWELAVGGGGINVKPMATDTLSELNAKFGDKLRTLKTGNGTAAPPAKVPAKAGADEEIPF